MKLLLDTHVLIWSYLCPEKIGKKTIQLLSKTENELFVSAVSAAEIACLVEGGKIELSVPVQLWGRQAAQKIGAKWIDLTADEAMTGWNLKGEFHRDPGDRLLVAQAIHRGLTLVTADERILEYKHLKSWKALH